MESSLHGMQRSRKSWIALWFVLFTPLWIVIGVLLFVAVTMADRALKPYFLSGLLPSIELITIGSFVLAAGLTVFLARQGIKRGWNTATALRQYWSLTAVVGIVLAVSAFLFKRKMNESTVDKVVISQARQLSVAADQYFLENGVSTVSYDSIVGVNKLVKAVYPSHQEIYPAYYTQGVTITITGVSGVRTVTYAP